MRLLIAHTNFPAQFRRLVPAWVALGHDVVFIAKSLEWHAPKPDGFRLLSYKTHREDSGPYQHPYLRRLEAGVIEGQAAFRVTRQLLEDDWVPDYIINHVGFGVGLFLADIFPDAKKICLFEWFYNSCDSDVDFLPPHTVSEDHKHRLKVWNTEMLHELVECDFAVVPTLWQQAQFPQCFRSSMNVIHEGVDIAHFKCLRSSINVRPACLPADDDIQVLTYVSRCFESYRGFEQVIEVVSRLLKRRRNLHVLMVGQDCTAYGSPRPDGLGWSDWARSNVPLDSSRVHWLGSIQDSEYKQVLASSDVHLYLTIPFILSWSLLEAMAAGCAIVSCSTPPVQEVLDHEHSALLAEFFDVDAHVDHVEKILNNPELALHLASQAQLAVKPYGFENGLTAWNQLLYS